MSTTPLPDDALWILQLSDTHLYADPDKTLAGVNTLDSMRHTLATALQALPRDPDMIIATGDLVHDASPAGYQTLSQLLLELQIPAYCLPGNHDNASLLAKSVLENGLTDTKTVDTEHWRILLLDSTIAGEESGHLSDLELAWLEQQINSCNKYLMVCLHHQPILVGSRWIDSMAVDNRHELVSLLQNQPRVKGVVWGHVHQAFEHIQDGIHWLSSPSTCIQFAPGSDDFALDRLPPGCRVLTLGQNGEFGSRILRADELPFNTNLDLAGY